ncbi:MerR family transcriptional regulator [Nocardia panacis]|uniref:MerR family transcriptional regulator n=1 Tax=Nocardia panacis TaxID=2340916 RepID=A0A3A4KTG3_9NOCA|nr:MerR family transcriptional regulator [Nocardia panacis]RJO79827.1 MerR family transcriptional regulator [Nocardia panacis]
MTAGVEYTIDELARAAGTTVRSLRVYHERGVLPPPQVKGRTGFYGEQHLRRVHTIGRLLERGIKLNGIRELLEALERGEDLGAVLGISEAVAPVAAEVATIAAVELAQRYQEVPNGLARVVTAGLYEPVDAATYRVADPALVAILDRLVALDIPLGEALGELERLRTDCERIARRFADLFEYVLGAQQLAAGEGDLAEFTKRLAERRVLPGQAAAELVNRYAARYFDQLAGEGDVS